MAVPYTFGSATASIPLSQLDSNFATTITLGNVAVQLGNTVTSLTGVTNVASATSLTLGSNGNTTAVTIDTSQNVGVGVTPSAWSTSYKAMQIGRVGAIWSGTSGNDVYMSSNFYYDGTNNKYITTNYASYFSQNGGGLFSWNIAPSGTAGTNATFTQAMTLDASGNFLLGVTTAGSSGVSGFSFNSPTGSSNVWIGHTTGTASGTAYVGFNYNGSGIGSITQNGTTGVLYNLTSDYRLKNNQEDLTGAKNFIMALKPKKWQWWDGSGEGVGFIAHEFMEVAKYSGHGEKDAVETIEIKDEDGNVTGTEERPVYQSIQPSSSEVMANLVSLIQEQQALITSLTERITALEEK